MDLNAIAIFKPSSYSLLHDGINGVTMGVAVNFPKRFFFSFSILVTNEWRYETIKMSAKSGPTFLKGHLTEYN